MLSCSDNKEAESIKKPQTQSVHTDAQSWMFTNKHTEKHFCCTAVLFMCLWKAAGVHFTLQPAMMMHFYNDAIFKIAKGTRERGEMKSQQLKQCKHSVTQTA